MIEFIERHKSGRVFAISFCVLAVLLISLVTSIYNLSRSYSYKGQKLKLSSVDEGGVIMTDKNGVKLVMSVINPSGMSYFDKECEIHYLAESLRYKSDFNSMESVYIFSDGSSLIEPLITVEFSYGGGSQPNLSGEQIIEKSLITKLLEFYSNEKTAGLYIGYAFLGLLFVLLGVGLFLYPESFWRFQTMFTVKNGEPTDWAVISNMLLGVIIVLIAFVGLYYIWV